MDSLIALSTRPLAARGATVADQCLAAHGLGFRAIALAATETTPRPGALAAAKGTTGVQVAAVRAGCLERRGPGRLPSEEIASLDAARAARAAASIAEHVAFAKALGCPRLVLEGGAVEAGGLDERLRHAEGIVDRGESAGELLEEIRKLAFPRREAHLDRLCRALHALCHGHPETTFALLPARRPHDLLGAGALRDVLSDVGARNLGVWADAGRLRAAERLGVEGLGEVLPAFAGRWLGIDLHDARGLREHLAPGDGEVDWKLVAAHLPRGAVRVLDLDLGASAEAIRTARRVAGSLGLL